MNRSIPKIEQLRVGSSLVLDQDPIEESRSLMIYGSFFLIISTALWFKRGEDPEVPTFAIFFLIAGLAFLFANLLQWKTRSLLHVDHTLKQFEFARNPLFKPRAMVSVPFTDVELFRLVKASSIVVGKHSHRTCAIYADTKGQTFKLVRSTSLREIELLGKILSEQLQVPLKLEPDFENNLKWYKK